MVAGTQKRTVPLFRQGLPVEVVGGGSTFDGGGGGGAVLMDDEAAQGFDVVGDPEGVGDGRLQFALDGGAGIIDSEELTGRADRGRDLGVLLGEDESDYGRGVFGRQRVVAIAFFDDDGDVPA